MKDLGGMKSWTYHNAGIFFSDVNLKEVNRFFYCLVIPDRLCEYPKMGMFDVMLANDHEISIDLKGAVHRAQLTFYSETNGMKHPLVCYFAITS